MCTCGSSFLRGAVEPQRPAADRSLRGPNAATRRLSLLCSAPPLHSPPPFSRCCSRRPWSARPRRSNGAFASSASPPSSRRPGARAVAFVQAASAAFLPVSVPVRTWISGSATDCTRHRHIPSPGSSFLPVSAPEAQTSCGVCLSTGPTGGGLHRFILRVAYKFLESTISRRSSFKQGSAIADDMEVRELSAKLKSLHLEHKPLYLHFAGSGSTWPRLRPSSGKPHARQTERSPRALAPLEPDPTGARLEDGASSSASRTCRPCARAHCAQCTAMPSVRFEDYGYGAGMDSDAPSTVALHESG